MSRMKKVFQKLTDGYGKKMAGFSKTSQNLINTIGMIVLVFIVIQILSAAGALSYSFSNLLVGLCIYSIVAVGLNLCVGYLGELSLGHAAFMSVGAFSSALFSNMTQNVITVAPIRFVFALLVGIIFSALFGFLIGIPVLRLNGDYLAIVTLAFGEIIKGLVNVLYIGMDKSGLHFAFIKDTIQMDETGRMIIDGAQGISGTEKISTFTIGVILLILVLLVVTFLVNSRTGRAIMAIRDNRIAAESVGIEITRYKIIAFTISAAIAGVAGVLYAHYYSSLTANKFDYNTSILILVFVVLGGMANFRGSIIAAIVLTLLPEMLRGLSDYRMLIYAIILIVMMLLNWAPAAIEKRQMLVLMFKEKFSRKSKEV